MTADKHAVRKFLENHLTTKEPLPSQDEIRRQLGWGLLQQPPPVSKVEPSRR